MAPTPDGGPRVGLLVALSLVTVGAGVLVYALLSSPETSSPPPAAEIATLLAGADPAGAPFSGLTELRLAVGEQCVRIVVADSEAEQGQGLRAREDLGPYAGMLFVNESDTTVAYTMSGVTVPLDIGWYSHDGRLVDRAEMEPCPAGGPDCPLYSADGRYRFALETLRGQLPTGSLGACPS
jgi:uncharacterized membrane protein (UPF0127 family)